MFAGVASELTPSPRPHRLVLVRWRPCSISTRYKREADEGVRAKELNMTLSMEWDTMNRFLTGRTDYYTNLKRAKKRLACKATLVGNERIYQWK